MHSRTIRLPTTSLMPAPYFSVVIPAYNAESTVARCLESVGQQTFGDFEVIVVDDGSVDATAEMASAHPVCPRVILQQNRGPGAARNNGVLNARGRYIAFLDSDDTWFPWTLQTYLETIVATSAAFIAGLPGGAAFRLERSPPSSPRIRLYDDYLSSADDELWIGTCGTVIRRDNLVAIGGFATTRFNAEDSDLWMRLGDAPGFAMVTSPPCFTYIRRPNSETADQMKTYHGLVMMLDRESRAEYPGGPQRRRERLKILSRHVRPFVVSSVRRGEFRRGYILYLRTLKIHFAALRLRFLLGVPIITLLAIARRTALSTRVSQ